MEWMTLMASKSGESHFKAFIVFLDFPTSAYI